MISSKYPIYFFHGLKGTPQGIKARHLATKIKGIETPFLPENLAKRMEIVRELISKPSYIIGSSLGGLTAILFANERPELVKGLVLIAPAVGFYDPAVGTKEELDLLIDLKIPEAIPTEILAGSKDEVIPLPIIEALAKRSPQSTLTIIDDDHAMNQDLGLITDKLINIIAAAE